MITFRVWIGITFLLLGCGRQEHSVRFEAMKTPPLQFPATDSALLLSGEQLAYRYCQACHTFAEPSLLPKTVWVESVLPRMGHRLGIRATAREPYQGLSMYDDYLVRQAGVFPEEPQLSEESWNMLVEYYHEQAPDSLLKPASTKIKTLLAEFRPHPVRLTTQFIPTTTLTHIDTVTGHLWLGNAQGKLYKIDSKQTIKDSVTLSSPPADLYIHPESGYQVLTMGIMNPADQPKGKLWQVDGQNRLSLLIPGNLRRPVHFTPTGFNSKGTPGWLVAEFGNYLGQLAYYEISSRRGIQKQVLINSPGARKIEIADIDQDGLPDVTVLIAQGDERIITWYNQGNSRFRPQVQLRFPPVYGSSYFEMADFNNDGLPDLLYTNGDNADYSTVFKPYHGIRIYLQSDEGKFQKNYFQAMAGASKAMAHDFDLDGDLDIAAISFFPNFEQTPERGFLYLENQSSGNELGFSMKTFSEAANGHWLTMDIGDADQDGDADIVLGSFALPPSRAPRKLKDFWTKEGPDYMILENTVKLVNQ